MVTDPGWAEVCSVEDLEIDAGVCALVNEYQVALFYLPRENGLYAIDNYDPIGKANVLSRGVVGDIDNEPVVASPLYKQHFSLTTGCCLEDEDVRVAVYSCRLIGSKVQVKC